MMFIKGNKERVTFERVVEDIKQFMSGKDNCKIIVGADSQRVKHRFCFVVAIAVIDPGNGGIYFVHKDIKNPHRNMNVKSIIAWKTYCQAEYINKIILKLIENGIDYDKKITHHDLSAHGKSSQFIPGIRGWMTSLGYSPQFKPEAIIASSVANRYSKI